MTWPTRSSVKTHRVANKATGNANNSTTNGTTRTPSDVGLRSSVPVRTAYRRLMLSAACSRLAGSAELVMLNWWVLHATGNPAMIGVVTAARLVPLMFSAPVAGAFADRHSPFVLVTAMCGISAIFTAVLGLAVHGAWPVTIVCALLAVRGMAIAAEPTMRQLAVAYLAKAGSNSNSSDSDAPRSAATSRTVKGMADLSTIITLCLVAGPLVSGLLLATMGPGWGMAVLAGLIAGAAVCTGSVLPWHLYRVTSAGAVDSAGDAVAVTPAPISATTPECTKNVADVQKRSQRQPRAIAVMRNDRRLLAQVIVALGPMLAVFPYTSMLPVVMQSVASGMKETTAVAVASAAAALGGVVTTLTLRRRAGAIERPGMVAFAAAGISSVALVLCAVVASANGGTGAGLLSSRGQMGAMCIALLVLGGVGQLYRTTNRTAVVMLAPAASKGAVLGVSNMDRVLIPLGSMVCGVAATHWGVPWMLLAMALANVVLLVPALWLLLRSHG